ncbi:MAG: hypothetical protein ACRDNL_18035 [Spirillospora sp.]
MPQRLPAKGGHIVCALYEEAGRLRLGRGGGGPWLQAQLDPEAVHYLMPDPADYSWPGAQDGRGDEIRWWHCTALPRMYDGEQVTGMVACSPRPSPPCLPPSRGKRRLRLVHLARATERDPSLWGRDHKAECDPNHCGSTPQPEGPEPVGE